MVEYTDEFGAWWETLKDVEQQSVAAVVGLLEDEGPQLRPYRVLYAFDPRRTAILLIGGDKTGKDRWYEDFVPVADHIYDAHLATLKEEGLI